MSTAELIGWAALAIGFAGAFGIFSRGHALRRIGSLAMSGGLVVFCLITLHTPLNYALSGNPALPIIWILIVPTLGITISWLTRYFYRDLDLYDVEGCYPANSKHIADR
ncbi:hypothetical protein [Citricoccus sp.]|uniref:hypothetical protein n=1 Tax=Citricoccus sp. TaxID=1978372 RepID=UPI002621307F|nr:hypothetical protein [Citricoccus sp.]HRO93951.1 hypothetical protein [Citricoccus sp.]